MKKVITLEQSDINELRNIIMEALNFDDPTNETVVEYWNKLPENIKNDAVYWGINDSVVRNTIYEWIINDTFPFP